jgi:hypothetical protein
VENQNGEFVVMRCDDNGNGNQLEPRNPAKGRRQINRRLAEASERGETLTRTKALLLAALRVWELKRRAVD